jgi:hypothetical protein
LPDTGREGDTGDRTGTVISVRGENERVTLLLDRRAVLAGATGIAVLGGATYVRGQYASRHGLRFRSLNVVNETDREAVVTVRVETDDGAVTREEAVTLAAAGSDGGEDRTHLNGVWIKRADEYAIRAEHRQERVELTATEITERLDGAGWGSDCADVTLVVTAAENLTSQVAPSEAC